MTILDEEMIASAESSGVNHNIVDEENRIVTCINSNGVDKVRSMIEARAPLKGVEIFTISDYKP